MNTDNIPEELKSLDQWVCAWDHNKCPMSPYGYEGQVLLILKRGEVFTGLWLC